MLCNMCPRRCNVDRTNTLGVCTSSKEITVARAVRHFWEEPCISGKKGSGAIFFSGCNLKCIYCQNYDISRCEKGKKLSREEFQSLVLNIAKSDVDNINLVTPTHFTHQIISALSEIKSEIKVPIVWNTSGYEASETLSMLEGLVDIFLCDVKYYYESTSRGYSNASDYFDVTMKALKTMLSISPRPIFGENGMLKSGVIVRHLVLPFGKYEAEKILHEILPYRNSLLLSLMHQYTPNEKVKDHRFLKHRTPTVTYTSVVRLAQELGFNGYTQDRSSAKSEYTPDFDESWDFTY